MAIILLPHMKAFANIICNWCWLERFVSELCGVIYYFPFVVTLWWIC